MSCLFCDIVEKRRQSSLVYQGEKIVAFRDIRPQAPTHVLIVPRKHVPTINDLEREDGELVGDMVITARDLARKEGIAEAGYRLVWNCNPASGQAIYHLHLHLIGGRTLGWPPG